MPFVPFVTSVLPGKDYVGLGVGAVIVRDGKVLMLLRSDACRNNRGLWTIPGGMMELSEGLEDAVRREVREETGLHVTCVEFLCTSDRFFDGEHWVSILYHCMTEGEPSNTEPEKHRQIAWQNLEELPDNITLPSRDAIDAFRIHKGFNGH